jgi:phosphoglycolate phosphatase
VKEPPPSSPHFNTFWDIPPEDHDIPQHLSEAGFRHYSAGVYRFRHTVHRHTPKGELKPNPKVLADILEAVGAEPGETIYIGDKLHKDVSMAKKAGVMDVHACYGESHRREEYDLLKRVTHWTPEMVRAEQELTAEKVQPTHSIKAFTEVLDLFAFRQFEKSIVRG